MCSAGCGFSWLSRWLSSLSSWWTALFAVPSRRVTIVGDATGPYRLVFVPEMLEAALTEGDAVLVVVAQMDGDQAAFVVERVVFWSTVAPFLDDLDGAEMVGRMNVADFELAVPPAERTEEEVERLYRGQLPVPPDFDDLGAFEFGFGRCARCDRVRRTSQLRVEKIETSDADVDEYISGCKVCMPEGVDHG